VYMKLHKILSLILVAALAITVGLVGCSPQPGGGSGGGTGGGGEAVDKITIIFNFEGTYLPEDYDVIPFVVGGFNSINSNKYYEWEKVTNGGIKQDGTGSQVMTKINSREYKFEILTSDILLDPDTPTAVQFKAANYNPAGWSDLVTSFWSVVGNQLSSDEKIVISNNQIIEAYKPGSTDPVLPGESRDGIELSADGKTIKIYVGQHDGWSVHVTYEVTNVQLTLVVSNVATNRGEDAVSQYGFSGNFNDWGGPEPATILSTNDNGKVNIAVTITVNGNPTVKYKVRGLISGDWAWQSGGDKLAIIPPSTPSGSAYTNYYPGPVFF
jgi:hypothetical protein